MRWVLVLAAGIALACGPSGDDDDTGAVAGSGGQGASGGTAGAGATGAGMAGRAGTGGGGGAGTSGAANPDCTGTFGEPKTVFASQRVGVGSLALRADELELIYNEIPPDDSVPAHFRRSLRASKDAAFPSGEVLTPLDATCADSRARTGDLSNDGLRFYFICRAEVTDPPNAVHLARRASLDAPFVVDAATLGVARSGLAIDSDELMLVTSPGALGGTLLALPRASTAEPFGAEQALSGLDGLLTPDLSSDGRKLYASLYTDTENSTLVVAERTGPTAFAPPTVIRALVDPVSTVGSATISADCRALYYVSVATGPAYTVDVLRR